MLLGEPRPEVSVSVENYLQAIYKLEERDERVSTRLADGMNVSGATVVGMLKRLTRHGLLNVSTNKEIILTKRGREVAEAVVRRHRLAERMLTELLGVEWYRVHEEAHRFEHAISPYVEVKLAQALSYPSTCPWGHPIPNYGGELRPANTKPLNQTQEGEEAVIERMPEEDPRLLEFFDKSGMHPGTAVRVKEVAPFKGTVTVEMAGREVTLGLEVATMVLVRISGNQKASN